MILNVLLEDILSLIIGEIPDDPSIVARNAFYFSFVGENSKKRRIRLFSDRSSMPMPPFSMDNLLFKYSFIYNCLTSNIIAAAMPFVNIGNRQIFSVEMLDFG